MKSLRLLVLLNALVMIASPMLMADSDEMATAAGEKFGENSNARKPGPGQRVITLTDKHGEKQTIIAPENVMTKEEYDVMMRMERQMKSDQEARFDKRRSRMEAVAGLSIGGIVFANFAPLVAGKLGASNALQWILFGTGMAGFLTAMVLSVYFILTV